jgi:TM2 domain-containing membrane protein YozV
LTHRLPSPSTALSVLLQERRSVGLAYLLWAMAFLAVPLGLPGLNGLHRFYCSKPRSGALWLVSFGLLGIGQLIDLFLIPGMVEEANQALLLQQPQAERDLPVLPSLEKQLLQLARQRTPGGFTLNDALLEVDLLPGQSSASITKEIQQLLEADLLHVGNDERGRVVYREP